MTQKATTHGERSKQAILDAGLDIWRSLGSQAVSARRIAGRLDMTHGGVIYHWGSAAAMRDALAVEAVRIGDAAIVPQLIANRHAAVADMAADVRAGYLAGC